MSAAKEMTIFVRTKSIDLRARGQFLDVLFQKKGIKNAKI